MARATHKYKARPTLRGLVACVQDNEGKITENTLYPWTQVSFFNRFNDNMLWHVYDEHGNQLIRDGHKVQLIVTGVLDGLVGVKAQRRALKNALMQGEISIEMICKHNRIVGIIFVLYISILAIWLCVDAMPRIAEDVRFLLNYPNMMRPEYLSLVQPVIALIVAVVLLSLIWVCAFFYHLVFRPNVIAAHFDSKGLFAKLRDGREIRNEWADLTDLSFDTPICLHFRSGPTLWIIPKDRRTRVFLGIIEEMFHRDFAAARKRKARKIVRRIGIYLIIGVCVFVGLMYRMDLGKAVYTSLIPIAMLLISLIITVPVINYLHRIENAWLKKKQNRSRVKHRAGRDRSH